MLLTVMAINVKAPDRMCLCRNSCKELWEVQHLVHSTVLSAALLKSQKKCLRLEGCEGGLLFFNYQCGAPVCPDISLTVIRKALMFCLANLVKSTISTVDPVSVSLF